MRRLLPLLISLCAIMPAVAAAQDEPEIGARGTDQQIGSRFKMPAETASAAEARKMQKTVARCITYGEKDLVREILAKSDPTRIAYDELTDGRDELSERLDLSRCIGRAMSAYSVRMQMRFRYDTLRSLFAEEVYLLDVDDPLIIGPDEKQQVEDRYFVGGRANPMAEAMAELADCFSFHGASEGHEFLNARPGSDDERDAVEALLPVVGQCLGGTEEVDVDVSMLRKIVADGLWSRNYYRTLAPKTAKAAEE